MKTHRHSIRAIVPTGLQPHGRSRACGDALLADPQGLTLFTLCSELQDGYSPQKCKQEEQKKLATVHPSYEQGTNLCTHEKWAQPCFVKQDNLQEPEIQQNQVDEIICKDNLGCLW